MASLRKRGSIWYVRTRNEHGRQIEVKGYTDKGMTRKLALDLDDKHRRLKLGLTDPREADAADAARIPVADHVGDYLKNLESRGVSEKHLLNTRKYLSWFIQSLSITRFAQIRLSSAQEALASLKASGLSDQTISHHSVAIKSFTRWLKRDRRTKEDLLAELESPRVITTKKRVDLPAEIMTRLIEATRQGPVRHGLSGLDRSMLYLIAACTGLRRNELQSLTAESFDLAGSPAIVRLPAGVAKNDEAVIQPLPTSVVPTIAEWLYGKPAGALLWKIPQNTAVMVRSDLKIAGVEDVDRYDFHAIRHTFVSQVVRAGGSIKDSMVLARHHDPGLTFDRYSHARMEELAAVIDRLPTYCSQQGVSAGLNGSPPTLENPSPELPLEDPPCQCDQRPNLNQWLYSPILSV